MTMNRKDLQDQMIREIEFTCPEVLYTQVGRPPVPIGRVHTIPPKGHRDRLQLQSNEQSEPH